jgi:hypothetical protein
MLNAETSDFLVNRRDLKVLSEDHVRHIPWCISIRCLTFAMARIVIVLGLLFS